MAIVIQIRRDIAANWTSVNPLLAQGEWGEELDTLKFKVGDGALNWNALPYVIPSTDATTASNIGSGAGVFSNKAVNDLQFKSLLGANGVTVSSGVDTITISGATVITNHNSLNNLDYASANHTGFASTVALTTASGNILTYVSNNYIDNSEMTVISGNIMTSVSNNYIDNAEMATISGNIVSHLTTSGVIDHGYLVGLSDDDHTQYSLANGTRAFTSTVSGVSPTQNAHLTTKQYVDNAITAVSGSIDDHNELHNIQGGSSNNYYHLTSTDYTDLTDGGDATIHKHDDRYYTEAEVTTISGNIISQLTTHKSSSDHDSRYYTETEVNVISGALNSKIITDHGALTGLSDDDHTQYLNITRGDARYYTETEVDVISGALNTKLDTHKSSSDHDSRYYTETEVNVISGALNSKIITAHSGLTGLSSDDHTQYHTDARGDARYYTKAQTDTISGSLNTTINTVSGALNSKIDTHKSSADHDGRYYTQAQITTISGNILSYVSNSYIDNSEMTTISGNIVAQIPSLSGYATQTWTNTNFIDNTEMTTISGNITAQLHPRQHGMTSTSDHTAGNYKMFYSNGAGAITELSIGASGTVLTSTGAGAAPIFYTVSGTSADSADLACITIQTLAAFYLSTGWQDVTFPAIAYQNNTAILERDSVNTDRILIKETGAYLIEYTAPVYAPAVERIDMRVRKNDLTVISGSDSYLHDSMTQQVASAFVTYLNSGDFITLQALGQNTSEYLGINSTFTVVRLRGTKGNKGDTGSGSNIVVTDNGVTISGSPTGTINFVGHSIDASVSGTATVNNIFGSYFSQGSSDGESNTTNTGFQQKLRLTTASVPAGTYRIGWYYEWSNNGTTYDFRAQVQIDDTTTIMSHNEELKDATTYTSQGGFYMATLTAGVHNIDLDYSSENSGNTSYIRRARLEFWRVS